MSELVLGKDRTFARGLVATLLGSILLAVTGKFAIPLPFTPVPIALQPHIALMLGVLLGPKKGALAVLGFLAMGASGLPVFATGTAGLGVLLGPKGGYLIGYAVGAYLVGLIKGIGYFPAIIAGNLVIYLFGASYLALFVGAQNALTLGVVPFLVGGLLKSALLAMALERHACKLQRL